jgi:1-phosphofructokinase family hexose kinase
MIVCVAGNPSIDKLFEVEDLVPGAIHRPGSFLALPGGKGLHVAQVTTALGGEAIATGVLAGHTGRWVAETLAAEGVRSEFAWGPGETRSSLSVADRATGRLTEFYEDGLPIRAEDWSALVEIVDRLVERASWLALAGSLPAAADIEGYPRLMGAARRSGVPTAIDSRGAALARAVAEGPELVKINVHEAAELLGRQVGDVAQAREAAAEIRLRAGGDGHAAAVTLGEAGMVLVGPEGVGWHGTVQARGDYPVGSGDALLAGMLTALAAGEPWPRAAALGLGAAAANAEQPGAGRLDPGRARQLAEAAEVRALPED